MLIPGKRVIGQYVYYDTVDKSITVSIDNIISDNDILNLIEDPILVTDADGNILVVNNAFARTRGVEKQYLIGQNVKNFDPPSKICEVLKTKKKFRGLSHTSEDNFYVVDISPVLHQDVLLGAIMIVKDISAIEANNDIQTNNTKNLTDGISDEFIGKDPSIIKLIEMAEKVANSDLSVLITGETGTGKELLARYVHNHSMRSQGPFIEVNCSVFSPSLIESELFGYDDGAFTGSKKGGKMGLIEAANGGTLFLDEIGDMPLEFQPKILRVLEEQKIRRVGSNANRFIDIRLIAATNKRLYEMKESNLFRADLYYRISGVNLNIIPLRERMGDISILAEYFLREINKKNNKKTIISPSAMLCLQSYSWPGNVRELKNIITSLFYLCERGVIMKTDLPKYILTSKEKRQSFKTNVNINDSSAFEVRKQILYEFLKSNRIITNREYCELTKVNRSTAYRDLSRFVSSGVIKTIGNGRSTKYEKVCNDI